MRLTQLFIAIGLLTSPAGAEQMRYTPVNPSFGGNALNSQHLLAIANAQKNATSSDVTAPNSSSALAGSSATSEADRFVSQLQSRLYSALSSQVAEAIFGTNPQDSGTVTFGDTSIEFNRDNDAINLVITDFSLGTVTEIVVPQLVSN